MDHEKKKVFVADDDQGIQDALCMMLEFAGYTPIVLAGQSVVDQIYQTMPDIILLDISLSGADGREVAKELKESEHLSEIPIILLSANSQLEAIAKETQVDDFLEKPFDMNDLLTMINKHVE